MRIIKLGVFVAFASIAGGVILIAVKGGVAILLNVGIWQTAVQQVIASPVETIGMATSGTPNAPLVLGLLLVIGGVFFLSGFAALALVFQVVAGGVGRASRMLSRRKSARRKGDGAPFGVKPRREDRKFDDADIEREAGDRRHIGERIAVMVGGAVGLTLGLAERGAILVKTLREAAERRRGRQGRDGSVAASAPRPATLDDSTIADFQEWYGAAREKGGDQLAIARQAVDIAERMGPAERALVIEVDAIQGEFMLRMLDSWASRAGGERAAASGPQDAKLDVATFRQKLSLKPVERMAGATVAARQASSAAVPRAVHEVVFDAPSVTLADEVFEDDIGISDPEEIDLMGAVDGFLADLGDDGLSPAEVRAEIARAARQEVAAAAPESGRTDESAAMVSITSFDEFVGLTHEIIGLLDRAEEVASGSAVWDEELAEPEFRGGAFDEMMAGFDAFVTEIGAQRILEESIRNDDPTWAWIRSNLMPVLADPDSYRERIIGITESSSATFDNGWVDQGEAEGDASAEDPAVAFEASSNEIHASDEGAWSDETETPDIALDHEAKEGAGLGDFEMLDETEAGVIEGSAGGSEPGELEANDPWSDDPWADASTEHAEVAEAIEGRNPVIDKDPGDDAEPQVEAVPLPRNVGLPEEQEISASGDIIAKWGVMARSAGANEATVGRSLYVPGKDLVFRLEGIIQAIMTWKDVRGNQQGRINVVVRRIPEGSWRIAEEGGLRVVADSGDYVEVSAALIAHPEVAGQRNILHLYGPGVEGLDLPQDRAGFRITGRVMDAEEIRNFIG